MSYLVLARKYRPQSFEDLAGQDHIARTLANAIAGGRVAHAFLFTGVRGVGKTTSARLLAKCLNCAGADGTATGPTAIPCQVCPSCREITSGQSMDVQEIDGASYNGVDEVRRLQEGINFRPARDRYKIYVVDEVHMLSNAAWNAFLKTLEEPPPHVKFIFATTEVHKVPVTIQSRCQRYDFKLIGAKVIGARLREVLDREAIKADDSALSILAREAAGSMRDAMSLLDQVIAFSGTEFTSEDVARVLGVADRKVLHDLGTALITGDATGALRLVDAMSTQGFDLAHVAKDLLSHLRNLVVAKVCGEAGRDLLELPSDEQKDIYALVAGAEADDVNRLFQGFSDGFDDIVRSGHPRSAFEMTLVRLAQRPPLVAIEPLLRRLEALERRLNGGDGSGSSGPSGGERAGGRIDPSSAPAAPRPVRAEAATTAAADPDFQPPHAAFETAASPKPPVATTVPHVPATLRPPAAMAHPTPIVAAAPPVPSFAPTAVVEPIPTVAAPVAPAPKGAPLAPSKPVATEKRVLSAPEQIDAWKQIVGRVRDHNPAIAAVYEHAKPVVVGFASVVLEFELDSVLTSQANAPTARMLLQREIREFFDHETALSLTSPSSRPDGRGAPLHPSSEPPPSLATIEAGRRRELEADARHAIEHHPLVQASLQLLEAEIKEIRLPLQDH